MSSDQLPVPGAPVRLRPVDRDNWRAVAQLEVSAAQQAFVAQPCYYLALCCYDNIWHPLAICLGEQVIGFLMWGVDPADGSCWLGGILIDQRWQRRGYGKRAIQAALATLAAEHGYQRFALSYQPANTVAKSLYQSLGFSETSEWDEDEIVARLTLAGR